MASAVCRAFTSCWDCVQRAGCNWGILYQKGGKCVADSEELGKGVIGMVYSGGFCGEPQCLIKSVIDWSMTASFQGTLSFAGSILIGAVFIGIFFWCQKTQPRGLNLEIPLRELALEDFEEDGYQPPIVGYRRRQNILRILGRFLRMQGNEQDQEVQQRVARAVGQDLAREANVVLERISGVQTPQQQPQARQIPPENVNPIIRNANQAQAEDFGQPAVLTVDPPVQQQVQQRTQQHEQILERNILNIGSDPPMPRNIIGHQPQAGPSHAPETASAIDPRAHLNRRSKEVARTYIRKYAEDRLRSRAEQGGPV